jgi:hypothetical protein
MHLVNVVNDKERSRVWSSQHPAGARIPVKRDETRSESPTFHRRIPCSPARRGPPLAPSRTIAREMSNCGAGGGQANSISGGQAPIPPLLHVRANPSASPSKSRANPFPDSLAWQGRQRSGHQDKGGGGSAQESAAARI